MAESITDIEDTQNERWKEAKRMAAELSVPIAVIDVEQCTRLEFAKVQDMVKQVKDEKRMDLIPQIIHKMENNVAAQMGLFRTVRNEIFSRQNVKRLLDEIVGAIITSPKDEFNYGIEQFVKTTREIQRTYEEQNDLSLEECQSYDYNAYMSRLKTLYSSRNGLNGSGTAEVRTQDVILETQQDSRE